MGDTDDTSGTDDDQHDDDDRDGSGTDQPDVERMKRALRKANREAAANRKRVEELERQVKDAGDGDKPALQKLEERLAGAERRAEQAELKSLRAEIAADKGLTARQAKRLVGTTREELEEDADDLLDDLGLAGKNGKKGGSGKGAAGDEDKGSDDGSDDDDDGKGGDAGADKSKSKPKEKLRSGASSESETDGKSGEELADEVWKRTHGGI